MKWKVQMYSHTALPEPTPTRAGDLGSLCGQTGCAFNQSHQVLIGQGAGLVQGRDGFVVGEMAQGAVGNQPTHHVGMAIPHGHMERCVSVSCGQIRIEVATVQQEGQYADVTLPGCHIQQGLLPCEGCVGRDASLQPVVHTAGVAYRPRPQPGCPQTAVHMSFGESVLIWPKE